MSIVIDREFVVNVNFSRKSFEIYIIREFIRIWIFDWKFFFRKFDNKVDNRIVIDRFLLVIFIFIYIVTIVFVKMIKNIFRIENLVHFQKIVIFDTFVNKLCFNSFLFFSIVLNLKRNFSKTLSISNKFCFCFLYILTNWWKFSKTIQYLFRSIRKLLNSFKKSLKWLLIYHFNWRTISMFKKCVTSSFSFDTTSNVKKIDETCNESWIFF